MMIKHVANVAVFLGVVLLLGNTLCKLKEYCYWRDGISKALARICIDSICVGLFIFFLFK